MLFMVLLMVLGNIKHFSDKKDISLSKFGPGNSVYSNVNSLSGDDEDISMADVNSGFLLGLAATTFKAKHINTGTVFGSPLGSPDFIIDNDKIALLPYFMEMATSLAKEKGINVNSNFKKQKIRSDQAVVIKEISMNTPKDMIIAAVSKFGEIKLIKIQLIGMIYCAVVGFEFDDNLESVFYTKPILGSIKLSWIKMDLVWCKKYRKSGHSALECDASVVSPFKPSRTFKRVVFNECCLQLAKLYEKKSVPISCSAVFGGKFWAQVVSFAGSSDSLHFASGSGFPFSNTSELLTDQVSGIVHKLSNMNLVPQASTLPPKVSAILITTKEDLVLDTVMDDSELVLSPFSSASPSVSTLGLSSSKVLTIKVGSLESKLVAFKASGINVPAKQANVICWHKNMSNLISIFTKTKLKNKVHLWIARKFEGVRVFTSGLNSGYLGASIVVIINSSLVKHVCKIFKMPGQLFFIKLLFKNKLSVSVLELYAGALSAVLLIEYRKTQLENLQIIIVTHHFEHQVMDLLFTQHPKESSVTFGVSCEQPPLQQQLLQQPQQQLNINQMAYAPIAKLENFTSEEDDAQAWINNISKTIIANNWNNARALQAIPYFLKETANSCNIPPAMVTENKTLAAIFLFEFEKTTPVSLFSGAALEEKPITTMYTDAKIDGHSIKLILNSGLVGSIITQ
ncbi:hypothetical protein G9A89_023866 [Geosiphon pyriformis]|nr:hypothetical protein G9A89_023866 [Geosiphon pyriformis]